MLSNVVTAYFESRIPERIERVEADEDRSPFLRIVASESDFGDLELYDDGDEVTIVFGRFTHSHFSNYEDDLSLSEKEDRIAEDVFGVISATLDDELEFWGSHQGSGGYRGVDYANRNRDTFLFRFLRWKSKKTFYRWSGATRKYKES